MPDMPLMTERTLINSKLAKVLTVSNPKLDFVFVSNLNIDLNILSSSFRIIFGFPLTRIGIIVKHPLNPSPSAPSRPTEPPEQEYTRK